MPSISTHMHFGKVLLKQLNKEIDLLNYVIGLISPKTILDEIDEYHTLDEDGNIDVREFYEKFNFKKLSVEARSFVLGYYSNLWLEEYYKFNAIKITIHNREELSDEELIFTLENTFKQYDKEAIGDFYEEIKESLNNYNPSFNLTETKYINFSEVIQKLKDYFNEEAPSVVYKNLIDEDEYNSFINKSCSKFLKSL